MPQEYNMGSDPALWTGGSAGPMPGMGGANMGDPLIQ